MASAANDSGRPQPPACRQAQTRRFNDDARSRGGWTPVTTTPGVDPSGLVARAQDCAMFRLGSVPGVLQVRPDVGVVVLEPAPSYRAAYIEPPAGPPLLLAWDLAWEQGRGGACEVIR